MVPTIRWSLAVLIGLLLTLPVQAQFDRRGGGAPGGPGGGGPSRGMMGDPNEMFNRMANGKEVLVRSEISNEFMQRMFDRIAGQLGVTNGTISRQQFTTYMQQRMAEGGRGGPGGPGGSPGAPGAPGAAPGGGSPWGNPDAMAEMIFRRSDQNGDGMLNYDEMSESLRAEREKYDTNRDGFIDQAEFKLYIQARFQASQNGGNGGGMGNFQGLMPQTMPQIEEEEQKPVVYRAGKLPKDMPSWFKQLDVDEDGQVGLYEWKASGRPFEEFDKLDRNGDGFVVVDEVLRTLPGRGTNTTATADSRSSFFNGPNGGSGMMTLNTGSDPSGRSMMSPGQGSMSSPGGDSGSSGIMSRSYDGRSGGMGGPGGGRGDRGDRGDRGSFGMGGSGGPSGGGRGDRGSFGMGGPGSIPGGGRGDRGSFGMGGPGSIPGGGRGDRGSFGMGGPGAFSGRGGDRGTPGQSGSTNGQSDRTRGGGPGRGGRP